MKNLYLFLSMGFVFFMGDINAQKNKSGNNFIAEYTGVSYQQLAKSPEQYAKLFNNKKLKIVRTHSDFLMLLNKSEMLKSKFTRELLVEFGNKLKMSDDGVVTFTLAMFDKVMEPSEKKKFSGIILQSFGISPDSKNNSSYIEGAYCGGNATCYDEVGAYCVIANCTNTKDSDKTGFNLNEMERIGL